MIEGSLTGVSTAGVFALTTLSSLIIESKARKMYPNYKH